MLPLNWLRKRYPNQIQAHVRGDGGDLLQWIRERLSHAPHGVQPRFWHVCLLASDAPGQEHRFHIPSQVHNLACSNRGKRRENREKRWKKDNHLFPAGKIAITLFSFSPSNPHEGYRCLLTCRNTRSLICSFFVLCFSVRLRLRMIVK